jgi:3-oxoacyl-[acyl-carrier-protein] synthase-3
MPGGGSLHPPSVETIQKKMHYVHQDGKNVFRYAVRGMAEVSNEMLSKHGLSANDLKLYIPHQANSPNLRLLSILIGTPIPLRAQSPFVSRKPLNPNKLNRMILF